jgi:hypothetical protein
LTSALGGKYPVKIVNVPVERVSDEFTVQVGEYYGDEHYRVQQILLPDRAGRYPGDPRCAMPFASVPVFSRMH